MVVLVADAGSVEAVAVAGAGVRTGFGGLAELGDAGRRLNKPGEVFSVRAEGDALALGLVGDVLVGEEPGFLLRAVSELDLERPEISRGVEDAAGAEAPEFLGEGVARLGDVGWVAVGVVLVGAESDLVVV